MKQLFYLLMGAMLLTSCTATKPAATSKPQRPVEKKYALDFYLEGSADSSLTFQDERTSWTFDVASKEINFTVQNKTDQPLKLVWDEAVIKVYTSTSKVMHAGVKYTERNNSQPPTMVLPKDKHTDLVLPSDNVYWKEGYYGQYYSRAGGWETKSLLLTSDVTGSGAVMGQKGMDVISLMMPVQDTEGKTKYYQFKFVVKDVKCTNCKEEKSAPTERKG